MQLTIFPEHIVRMSLLSGGTFFSRETGYTSACGAKGSQLSLKPGRILAFGGQGGLKFVDQKFKAANGFETTKGPLCLNMAIRYKRRRSRERVAAGILSP